MAMFCQGEMSLINVFFLFSRSLRNFEYSAFSNSQTWSIALHCVLVL